MKYHCVNHGFIDEHEVDEEGFCTHCHDVVLSEQEAREELCQYCRDGSPVGRIIGGTKINGWYAHRIAGQNVACEADLTLQTDEMMKAGE